MENWLFEFFEDCNTMCAYVRLACARLLLSRILSMGQQGMIVTRYVRGSMLRSFPVGSIGVYREHAGPTMLERKKKKNKPIRRKIKKEDSSLLFTGMKWKTWWTRDLEVLYADWMEGNWYRENESCFLSEIGQSG